MLFAPQINEVNGRETGLTTKSDFDCVSLPCVPCLPWINWFSWWEYEPSPFFGGDPFILLILRQKKRPGKNPGLLNFMERETRFELATSTLARLHSTTELFPLRQPAVTSGCMYNKTVCRVSIKIYRVYLAKTLKNLIK